MRSGFDTDTVAAIAGSLAGAMWGATQVPLAWQRALHGWPGYVASDLTRLGVLARIAQVFADHGVSIFTMQQTDHPHGDPQLSEIRLVTHRGANKDLVATVDALRELPFVEEVAGGRR